MAGVRSQKLEWATGGKLTWSNSYRAFQPVSLNTTCRCALIERTLASSLNIHVN